MEQTIAMEQILRNIILSIVFAVLGFGLLFLGYRVLDMLTPHSMTGQIFEEHNMAAAILAAQSFLESQGYEVSEKASE